MHPTTGPVPDGPVDPALTPQRDPEIDRLTVYTLMAPGWWPPPGALTQCYGFCFTPEGRVVLVSPGERRWTLPGGTV